MKLIIYFTILLVAISSAFALTLTLGVDDGLQNLEEVYQTTFQNAPRYEEIYQNFSTDSNINVSSITLFPNTDGVQEGFFNISIAELSNINPSSTPPFAIETILGTTGEVFFNASHIGQVTYNFQTPILLMANQDYFIIIRASNGTDILFNDTSTDTYPRGNLWAYQYVASANVTSGFYDVGTGIDLYPFNSQLVDLQAFLTYETVCTPDWSCTGYETCVSPMVNASCNSVTDLNTCGDVYGGNYSEFTSQTCSYPPPITGYVPAHSTSDISGVVVDFGVEFGLQIIAFVGLIALVGIGIWLLSVI